VGSEVDVEAASFSSHSKELRLAVLAKEHLVLLETPCRGVDSVCFQGKKYDAKDCHVTGVLFSGGE
jgi:hypothetical protein